MSLCFLVFWTVGIMHQEKRHYIFSEWIQIQKGRNEVNMINQHFMALSPMAARDYEKHHSKKKKTWTPTIMSHWLSQKGKLYPFGSLVGLLAFGLSSNHSFSARATPSLEVGWGSYNAGPEPIVIRGWNGPPINGRKKRVHHCLGLFHH